MGIAIYIVWLRAKKPQRSLAFTVFTLQLILNVLWSFLFFGHHQPGIAFVEIILMWLAIAATIKVFYPISKMSAWLLTPYLAWVTFASVLNFAVWQLNR